MDRRFEGKRTLYSIKDPQVLEVIEAVDLPVLRQLSQLIEAGKSIEEKTIKG